jgi:hypothetical protein
MKDISMTRILSNGHIFSGVPVALTSHRFGPVTSHDIHDIARRGGI